MITYTDKAKRMTEETVDLLRLKAVNSTHLERKILTCEAARLFCNLPQPLFAGRALGYVLDRVSCPVEAHDILVGRFKETVPSDDEEALFQRISKTAGFYSNDNGHTPFDWEELMRVGVAGYMDKCQRELERRRADTSDDRKVLYLEGALLTYKAYRRYFLRYAEAASRAGLEKAALTCQRLADGPPTTFEEAMQLVLLMDNVYSMYCVDVNPTLCCGRMDDYLLPFYQRDLESGILSREDAGAVIDDFNCKTCLPMGRGEHQMSDEGETTTGWSRNPMFDSPTYVILGGYSLRSDHRTNPLTELFVERINPRLENPVYVFRRTKDTPPALFSAVCDKMRRNASVLMYNDETVIPSFERGGVEHDDAVNYTIHGCNWPDLQGLNTYRVLSLPLVKLIMESILDEDGKPRSCYTSIDEIYAAVEDHFRHHLRRCYPEYRRPVSDGSPGSGLRFSDCFKRGVLERAECGHNSVKYMFIHHQLLNIASAGDVMSALDHLLFRKASVTLQRLAAALRADFEGYEDVLKMCLAAPKYGHDDELGDSHAARLVTRLTDIIYEEAHSYESGERIMNSLAVTITDMTFCEAGAELGATPDGRRAGAPLSENLSPVRGQSHAITSLINSVTRLPFDRISSGALNVRLPKDLVSGNNGLTHLCALMDTYFKKGGLQMQLSIADTSELRAAQDDPDSYRDLMVRITGYSAVFVDMSRGAQDIIIARDELG